MKFTAIRVLPAVLSLSLGFPLYAQDSENAESKTRLAAAATPVEKIKVADGFRVELLYSVPGEMQGSWVSLTKDDKGRLITCDQYGKLYRITPPPLDSTDEIVIEPIDVELGMAQGLLYAFDSLYVNVNGRDADKQGLYRVRDTDGDDKFDSVEWLRKLNGGGEHGPHAVVLSPDGKSLYVCCGNHTNPTDFASSRVPTNYGEDQLLPRMWDAGGHAVGRMAPGGWIAKCDPDGLNWEMVACGFRNEYDIAFNEDGELFTYDADMEWDVGLPWYRPTRVNHVTSGAEFGWRSGTGKWPEYYPDSQPAVVDIGPGCPTGIVFGTGAKFPQKYQRALFISDWSYGVIYAVHLKPDGATYTGTPERFVSAAPLPATDLVVADDGALYFTIGGRRTQSGLYRVTYVGEQEHDVADTATDGGQSDRKLRRTLEKLHFEGAEDAVEKAWPHLGSSDRSIRYAARLAIEHQPIQTWQRKVLEGTANTDAALQGLLALARHGDETVQGDLIRQLGKVSRNVDERQNLEVLRILALSFIRMGEPSEQLRLPIIARLDEQFPAASKELNRELSALLVYLQADSAAEKVLDLLLNAPTQEDQVHYALVLRALKSGWTIEQRKAYFEWFVKAASHRGGHSFTGFLGNIRQEAIDTLSETEKETLKEVLAAKPETDEIPSLEHRELVKKWTVDDLLADVEASSNGRNFAKGQLVFKEGLCFKCHRFDGQGGIVGPDLTTVGGKFNARNLLESLIEPSKVVSDQYEAMVFVMDSGKQIIGRVVNLSGDDFRVRENMLDPGKLTKVKRTKIEEMMPSPTSMMPAGLLDTFTKDEILDLVAYLRSGGNSEHPAFGEAAE